MLIALYSRAKAQGMGRLNAQSGGDLTVEEARMILASQPNIDYVRGRVIKVNLSGESFDPFLYDRDNGQGAAASAIESMKVNAPAEGHARPKTQ